MQNKAEGAVKDMEIKPTITKVNSVNVGRALTNFINSIDVSETRIGEVSENTSFGDNGGNDKFIYSGHWLHTGDSAPTWVLTAADKTKMVIRKKFRSAVGKNPDECINDYFKWCEESIAQGYKVQDTVNGTLDRLDRQTVLDIVHKLNKNKMVVVPLKYDNTKAVVSIEAEGVSTKRNMSITGVKWRTDVESGELLCEVMLEHRSVGSIGKSRFINITDYGQAFNLEAVEIANSSSKAKLSNVIEYDQSGYVKPVEITNGVTSIIIDNTYVYYKNSNGVFIVGEWVGNGLKMKYTNQSDKLFKKVTSYVKAISLHKRIIAPYLLVSTKVLNVKTK